MDKFIFPADFIILDYEADKEVPIILGRPFLATGRTLIDVQKGELTMRVQDEQVTFNVFKAMHFADDVEECSVINVRDSLVTAEFKKKCSPKMINKDNLAVSDEDEEASDNQVSWMESRHTAIRGGKQFESLELSKRAFKYHKPSIDEPPVLELKPLPTHLRDRGSRKKKRRKNWIRKTSAALWRFCCRKKFLSERNAAEHSGRTFKVNGQRLKHYWGDGFSHQKTSISLQDA